MNHGYPNFEENMKIISPGLLTLNPYFSNNPQYSYEVLENEENDKQECHISIKICTSKLNIIKPTFKNKTNSITVSLGRKVVKNIQDIQNCKFYFASHSKEINDLKLFIEHGEMKLENKMVSKESDNGILKLVYNFEQEEEDSD